MLSAIRDRLKTWVIGLLITLVAIPLVFLGVGDYGSNQEQYAFSVNDQDISKSIVQQEMSQFKDVLRKNYQGNIPPIYTDNFIKKITFDNLIRRNIENSISSNIGLVTSDESIINEIQETSPFRDENGFNPSLYKKRLFLINMNPDVYEQYLYQKGIREQLRKTITDTSILNLTDKKLNINANYHKRDGKILFLKLNDMKDVTEITLDEINDYYIKNKEAFMSTSSAEFSYLRLSKESIISSIEISNSELLEDYKKKIDSGLLSHDKTYTLNHLVFPVKDNKESALANANAALNELLSNMSFENITKKYEVDEDTKNNLGFIGKFSFDDLPNFIKNNLPSMKNGDIKLISSELNAIHIIKLIESSTPENKKFEDVIGEIKKEIQKNKGSNKYFSILDSIKEKIYIQNLPLTEVSKSYDFTLFSTEKIDQDYKDNILSRTVVNQLFNDISSTDIYPPIYISNDDVLFVKKNKYYPPSQLTLSES
ncbi:MAG: SurA N-terminal domain-containing protein, partial [Gammaproteobacteria bacterium]